MRPGDVIVCVGDSVTAAGVYDGFLQAMLDRLYPEAGIRIVNRGQGGQTAGAATGLLRSAMDAEHPTPATFMFGVNDTRWSAGDEDAKAAAFTDGLASAVEFAASKNVTPLLLRESHFSHGQAPDEFAAKVNGVFDRLMPAQDAFAAARQIPVIDTPGAYMRALAAAWAADPRYEFSPDIVHPNSAGHAAMAGEILRALGAGLPLAAPLAAPTGPRGPLPLARLRAERSAGPLYAAFRGAQRFTAACTLFFHSRIRPAAAGPVVFSATDFQSSRAPRPRMPASAPSRTWRCGATGRS